MPKVAIIVLFYKNPQDVEDCLNSLTQIDYPEDDFDIIAIDNFSQDETLTQKLRKYTGEIVLIETDKNLGYAGGNNLGLKYALDNDFDYVYVLNPDTEVEPDFLIRAVELAEGSEKIGLVQSKILLHGDKTKIQTSGNQLHFLGIGYSGNYNKTDDLSDKSFEIGYASGAGVLIKAEVLQEVGLFDEKYFMYHEDLDLSWMARICGFKLMTEPKSVIHHKYEFSRNKGKYKWMERNRWWTLIKNYKLMTLALLSPALLVLELMLFIYAGINGWLIEKIKSCFGFWLGLGDVLKQRKQVQQKRNLSDKELMQFMTAKLEFSGMTESIFVQIANLFFGIYFWIVRKIIFW